MSKQFTMEQIGNDPIIQKFLKKKLGRAEQTITGYLISMRDFCNFTGKSPSEIHDIHRDDLRNNMAEFDMWLNFEFDNYIAYLTDSGYAYNTINLNINHIKGFLHAFKLRPTPKADISKKHVKEDSKYALTVEDIRKAIKHCNPTYQTFFITQAQTGLSLSDALLLDVDDFTKAVSNKNEILSVKEAINRVKTDDNIIGCFDLRRKKTTIEFYTFAGPEVLHSIASLLELRNEEHLKLETPIFIKDISRLPKKDRDKHLESLRLKPKVVENYVDRLHKKKIFPRITVDGKERNYFRTHKLRKWFSNQLRFKAGFSSDDTKYLMGQKTGDVLEQYFDPNNYNALKGNYRKALPHLAITEEVVLEDNLEAIEKLQRENETLKQQYETDSIAKEEKMAKMAEEQENMIIKMELLDKKMKEKMQLVDKLVKKEGFLEDYMKYNNE